MPPCRDDKGNRYVSVSVEDNQKDMNPQALRLRVRGKKTTLRLIGSMSLGSLDLSFGLRISYVLRASRFSPSCKSGAREGITCEPLQ